MIMFESHYSAMVVSYVVALGGWLVANRVWPRLWPRRDAIAFAHRWRELGVAIIGVVAVIGIGQLWSSGIRLPETGTAGPMFGAINQALIFAPMLLVVALRRQPWSTAWLSRDRLGWRLLVGIALSFVAVTTYSFVRHGAASPWTLVGRIWQYGHVDELTQVFLEDMTIAILFVRMAAAIGTRWSAVIVAGLFAAGHIPALLASGTSGGELLSLVRDAALGTAVILVLNRSRDIVWFWLIHFALDLLQFAKVNGIG
jgi:hypothetical protein